MQELNHRHLLQVVSSKSNEGSLHALGSQGWEGQAFPLSAF